MKNSKKAMYIGQVDALLTVRHESVTVSLLHTVYFVHVMSVNVCKICPCVRHCLLSKESVSCLFMPRQHINVSKNGESLLSTVPASKPVGICTVLKQKLLCYA